jgi:hypothetical protein
MQIPIRTIVLGLLLAFSEMAVGAQSIAPEAALPANAATKQQSLPLEFALRPAAAPQPTTAMDLTLRPAAATQSTPIDLALRPVAAAPPSGPIDDLTLQSASEEVKRVAR